MKDHRVLEELFLMHLLDGLADESDVTSGRMHSIFVTALHNSAVDASTKEMPLRTRPRTFWKQRLSLNTLLFQAAIAVAFARLVLSRKGLIL